MTNEDMLLQFGDMSYSQQQQFINDLRRSRESSVTNNVVKERKVKRAKEDEQKSLIDSLTEDQIALLMSKLA